MKSREDELLDELAKVRSWQNIYKQFWLEALEREGTVPSGTARRVQLEDMNRNNSIRE